MPVDSVQVPPLTLLQPATSSKANHLPIRQFSHESIHAGNLPFLAQDDELDAPVLGPAARRVLLADGFLLAVAVRLQTIGLDAVIEQISLHRLRPIFGEP